MAKTTKAERAAVAALDAAATAAKDAKRLSKTLPKKDAKKLRSLADDAKEASYAPKKKVARHPQKVEKKAVAAIVRLEKAADKAEVKLADSKAAAARKRDAAARKSAKKAGMKQPRITDVLEDRPAVAAVEVVDAILEPAPVAIAPPDTQQDEPPAEDLASLTVVQLRERARAAGHTGFSRSNKAQLVALLSS